MAETDDSINEQSRQFARKRFSDFAGQAAGLDGEKLSISKIINLEVHVVGCRIRPSKYHGKNKSGQCLYLQIEMENHGPRYVVFTGSDVLISQMQEHEDEIPFWTTVRQVDKYYTMT